MKDCGIMSVVNSDHRYRIVAMRAPDNGCYVEKLVLIAMSNFTDECPKILGSLVVSIHAAFDVIDWIEVDQIHRRQGIGRRLWNTAEKLLGRELVHSPVTDEGSAFADAMLP